MKQNILIDSLPETVIVDGREFAINSDFRTSILFELMISDSKLPNSKKLFQALCLYYVDEIPDNYDEAIQQIIDFYSCGKRHSTTEGKGKAGIRSPVYSFEHDDGYIFSAFLDQYGIDLNEIEYLHWWKFKAMFDSLKSDNEIVKIMSYRAADISSIKDKEERKRMAKLKALYSLPNNMTFEEKVSAAGAVFGGSLR